jgi:hypothetical protein
MFLCVTAAPLTTADFGNPDQREANTEQPSCFAALSAPIDTHSSNPRRVPAGYPWHDGDVVLSFSRSLRYLDRNALTGPPEPRFEPALPIAKVTPRKQTPR